MITEETETSMQIVKIKKRAELIKTAQNMIFNIGITKENVPEIKSKLVEVVVVESPINPP